MIESEPSLYFLKRALLSLSDALEIASKVEVRKWCGRSLPLLPESASKTKVTMFSVDSGGSDSGFQKMKIILSGARFASWAITGVYTFESFGCIGNCI